MVLESQRVRASGARSYMGSRRRRKSKIKTLLMLLVLAGVCYLAYSVFFSGNTEKPDENPPPDNNGQANAVTPQNSNNNVIPNNDNPQKTHPLLGGTNTDPANTHKGDGLYTTPPVPNVGPVSDPPQPPVANTQTDSQARQQMMQGTQLLKAKQWVEARRVLNAALLGNISEQDANTVRGQLQQLNEMMVFSPQIVPGDPLVTEFTTTAEKYRLTEIAPEYDIPWELIQRINQIDPRRIRVGQRMKILKGPFHVIVYKHAFRADVYGEGPNGPIYVRSFKVGLGKDDSTPIGSFQVKRGSKLINPRWANPRTGKAYDANDPDNPIGERWIGLDGADDNTSKMSGYGLHGTIEPESIGTQASMGCVRFHAADIELLYDMLVPVKSKVAIKP